MKITAACAIVCIGAATALLAQEQLVVSQQGRVFTPDAISIAAGETVYIANDDGVLHHVYVEAPGFEFDSGEQEPGHTVAITFTKPGEFTALCAIHPKMKLHVTVRDN
jgi:plastocyanin